MSEIKDSGERRLFDSGAIRDIQEGKGRCDLMPLDEISTLMGMTLSYGPAYCHKDQVIEFINQYVVNGDTGNLYTAIQKFLGHEGVHPITAILEVSKHYEQGAIKYVERNWEKGIPLHSYIDSGVRHYLKHLRGDRDEPHDRAFLWNMLGAIWTHNHKPGLIDLPFKDNIKTSTPDSNYSERIADRAKKHRETSFA